MVYNTLDKRILLLLLAVLVLPCGIALTLNNSFNWWILFILALAAAFTFPIVRIGFTFDAVWVYGYWLYCTEHKFNAIKKAEVQFDDLKDPDTPTFILLNGCSKLRLRAFSPAKRREISNTLTQKLAENRQLPSLLTPWLKQRQKSKGKELLAIAVVTLICSAFYTADLLRWVWIVENWQPHEVLIQERGQKKVRRNRRTRTIDTVRYTYQWNGKSYQGDSILFANSYLPSRIKPGRQWFCLVNPSDPADSYLTTGQGDRRYRGRFIVPGVIGIIGGVLLLFALRSFRRKPPQIPPELLEYINTFPKAELNKLNRRVRYSVSTGNFPVRVPFRIAEGRYGYFPQKPSVWNCVFWGVAALPFLLGGIFFSPVLLCGLLYILIMFLCFNLRSYAVLDLQERTLFYCLFFRPGKKVKKKISLDKISYLTLATHAKSGHIQLNLVEKDGSMYTIGTAHPNCPQILLQEAPKIAERLGHLPIILD